MGLLIQNWTQERVNPIIITIIGLMQGLFGAVFSWTLGGEEFIPQQLIGGLIVLIAMYLSITSDKDADLKSID